MLMSGLITKKRRGGELSTEEISWMTAGYTAGEIPDYQMSAMLMAICFTGMTSRETRDLTLAMLSSGDSLDLSRIPGVKADKHSTGGVGDKTSLILCPMVACCGVRMAKMSGRGLGHSGGTIDKLESFPGLTTSLTMERFFENVEHVGFAIAGQTGDLCPADKKLYALRDVTGTVDSIPLIVGSIMSKKLAAGADVIVLDVKSGSGGFMRTDEAAFELARELVRVGTLAGRKVAAVVTDMDQPLGRAVGNALEVKEAISVLRGETRGELRELCLALGAEILTESGAAASEAEARERLNASIDSGKALCKLADFVEAQGGDPRDVYDTTRLPQAPAIVEARATDEGYVNSIATDGIGMACLRLGGGRATKDSVIDLSVGVVMLKKSGERVERGEPIALVHGRGAGEAEAAAKEVVACVGLSRERQKPAKLIKGIVRGSEIL